MKSIFGSVLTKFSHQNLAEISKSCLISGRKSFQMMLNIYDVTSLFPFPRGKFHVNIVVNILLGVNGCLVNDIRISTFSIDWTKLTISTITGVSMEVQFL